jgi:hypothetical protein
VAKSQADLKVGLYLPMVPSRQIPGEHVIDIEIE